MRRFARSEDGSMVVFALFILILMLGAGGLGIDFMRYEAQRTRLQATLDRAVLAAASLDQPLDPEAVVLDYFAKAGLSGYITADDIDVVDTLTSRRVTATASMDINATLLQFLGVKTLSTPAGGAAEESASQTEISLVLDVSGSMSWTSESGYSKIYELRKAAKEFINIVLCDPSDPQKTTDCTVEPGKVSVNIIPYSEQVLVGESLLSLFNATSEHNFSSCVNFDADDFDTTSITPLQELQRTGHFDPWSGRNGIGQWTCATNSWRELTVLGSNAATLRSRINALGASGNTSIDLGMKWGAAFLDPATQPVITDLVTAGTVDAAYDGRPLDWTERGVEKVIVLMTDGINTDQHYLYDDHRVGPSPVWRTNDKVSGDYRYSIYRESNGQYYWPHSDSWDDHAFGTGSVDVCEQVWVSTGWWWGYWDTQCTQQPEPGGGAYQLDFTELWATKSWAWYDNFWFLPSHGSEFGNSTKNARLDDICTAAKDQDITIFSVGFEVTSASATVMRNCANSPAHYFDVDGLDLSDAFAAIAREISKLRLVN
ncbi:pilus assembly protein [Maritimibacter fusiformis]|nr:TadE/TadG family type IV pilus assembly protein [Maritimibacter fusiformis]